MFISCQLSLLSNEDHFRCSRVLACLLTASVAAERKGYMNFHKYGITPVCLK